MHQTTDALTSSRCSSRCQQFHLGRQCLSRCTLPADHKGDYVSWTTTRGRERGCSCQTEHRYTSSPDTVCWRCHTRCSSESLSCSACSFPLWPAWPPATPATSTPSPSEPAEALPRLCTDFSQHAIIPGAFRGRYSRSPYGPSIFVPTCLICGGPVFAFDSSRRPRRPLHQDRCEFCKYSVKPLPYPLPPRLHFSILPNFSSPALSPFSFRRLDCAVRVVVFLLDPSPDMFPGFDLTLFPLFQALRCVLIERLYPLSRSSKRPRSDDSLQPFADLSSSPTLSPFSADTSSFFRTLLCALPSTPIHPPASPPPSGPPPPPPDSSPPLIDSQLETPSSWLLRLTSLPTLFPSADETYDDIADVYEQEFLSRVRHTAHSIMRTHTGQQFPLSLFHISDYTVTDTLHRGHVLHVTCTLILRTDEVRLFRPAPFISGFVLQSMSDLSWRQTHTSDPILRSLYRRIIDLAGLLIPRLSLSSA